MLNAQFPLSPALSLRERDRSRHLPLVKTRGCVELWNTVLLLPKGEGWAEGREYGRNQQRGSSSSARANNLPILLSLAIAIVSLFGCTSPGDSNPQIYDTHADGEKQLAEALQQAKAEHKRVLLDLGANWCGDSQAMFRVLSTNREIQSFISENYVFDLIDVNQHGLHSRNTRLLERLGNPTANGIPVLLILDENGRVLNPDSDERLRDSDHQHPLLVLAYLRKWAGPR
jgi:thiol:disulfide interchange protein